MRFRREPAVVGVLRSTWSSSTAGAVTGLAGRVRAWALVCRASRHRPDARYLFIGWKIFLAAVLAAGRGELRYAVSVIS